MKINLCIFIFVNWSQTLALIFLLYKIRNVKDELNLKNELRLIILIWLAFSLCYFICLQVQISSQKFIPGYSVAIFSMIQLRNISSFSVSTYFCYKTFRDPVVAAYRQNACEFPT
jgi:hypothetical protein